MLLDYANKPFDPFSVGPDPSEHMPSAEERRGRTVSGGIRPRNSPLSQVALSRAINEEMVAAKHGVSLQSRINAGAQPAQPVPANPSEGDKSTNVIMGVRKRLSISQSEVSSSNVVSIASSKSSVGTQVGKSRKKYVKSDKKDGLSSLSGDRTDSSITLTRKSQPVCTRHGHKRAGAKGATGGRDDQPSVKLHPSLATVRSKTSARLADRHCVSRVSVVSKAKAIVGSSRASVRSKPGQQQADHNSRISAGSKASRVQAGVHQPDLVSRASVRSKSGEEQAHNQSRISVGSKASRVQPDVQQSDHVSRVSVRSKPGQQQADHNSRISAGSKASRFQAGVHQSDHVSRVSVRSKPREQQSDNQSRISIGSKASRVQAGVHQPDLVSRVSVRSKLGEKQAHNQSRISVGSKASRVQADVQQSDHVSRVSVRSKLGDNQSRISVGSKASRVQAGVHQLDLVSRASVRSKSGEEQADNQSRISVGSKASRDHAKSQTSAHQSDQASVKDKGDAASHVSKRSERQADNISHASIKSNSAELQADAVSHVSIKSKATEAQADNASHVSAKSKNEDCDADKISVKSKKLEPITWPIAAVDDVRLGSKRFLREDFVTRDLQSMTMATTKSLAEKTVELSDRLRAGNENLHNRFNALIRMYSNTEPLKRSREDRMSFWFRNSVLS